MALDHLGVHTVVPPVVVLVCVRLVADRVHSRGPGSGEPDARLGLVALCRQHQQLHFLLPVQPGDAAHHRVRRPSNHRGVPRGRHHYVSPEHLGHDDPGT